MSSARFSWVSGASARPLPCHPPAQCPPALAVGSCERTDSWSTRTLAGTHTHTTTSYTYVAHQCSSTVTRSHGAYSVTEI
eukprot:1187644-Prorocentrum_minimum.AAC.3